MIMDHYVKKTGYNSFTPPLPPKNGYAIYGYQISMTDSVEFYAPNDEAAIAHARETAPFGARLTKMLAGKVSVVCYERPQDVFHNVFSA